ncbi:MAG: hypothetical protein WD270_01990, partial [Acetobacterales bacterium]
AVDRHGVRASLIYVPPLQAAAAVMEALDAGIGLIVATAEGVPRHDAAVVVAAARESGARLVGFNTNGFISPGRVRMGGMGGLDPDEVYPPGRVGICSRSGGMCSEIALALGREGLGVSTAVAMGGDVITGLRMVDYVRLFEADEGTDAIVLFGEPGTSNEREVAEHIMRHGLRKPVVALIVGAFQESYEAGVSFGHAAAMIRDTADSATAKRAMLRKAGGLVASTLSEVPLLLQRGRSCN